ncbi:hypothetical protein BA768_09755 [Chryseobacterium sp. CBo1]|uniref:hypothetical protein n=1 Tax=Chryseobacterium sp. CBo1 TaxID=1869230 RepID=UPI000810543E|nr:hypothetical protein [Chryseobacterium sp. CBo1]OCK52920.1 hypothetical protein BA768_09755 [Chryseobacterium sp. CBo1]
MLKVNFLCFVLILFFQLSYAQFKIKSISPTVDQQDSFNIQIIKTLGEFLETQNPKFWLESDFKRFKSPYYEIIGIESGKLGDKFYQPSLMEIIPTDEEDKRIVKLAFIGYSPDTKSNLVKAIYNVIAVKNGDKIFFSKYIDYATRNWKIKNEDNITYYISINKNYNLKEAEAQKKDINMLSKFFDTKRFPIFYYSTVSPEEVFKLKGFDYHPMMFADKSGGFAEDYNIVISGNNSEYYTHEIVHLYTSKLFPKINPFFDEGIATYFGGSGKFDYQWQKGKLKKFLTENPDFDAFEHLDVYERLYFEKETPIPYLVSAVLCEMIISKFGKEKLFSVFKNGNSVEECIKTFNLNKNNINFELRKFLKV